MKYFASQKEEYYERYDAHIRKYEKLKKRYEALDAERLHRKEQSDRLGIFIATLTEQKELPINFSEELWIATVDHVTVHADERVVFTFKSGAEITEQIK